MSNTATKPGAEPAAQQAATRDKIPAWKRFKMERKAVTIYMEHDAYKQVAALAVQQRRTLGMQLIHLIDEYLKNFPAKTELQ